METNFMKLWNYREPAETEAKFRELLPGAIASPDPSYYGELLTQIARTQGLQQKFDEAHKTLDLAEEHLEKHPKIQVRYCLERGRVLNSSGMADDAVPFFKRGYKEAEKHEFHGLAVDALHMLAIVQPTSKLDWELQAVDYIHKCGDENAAKWLGSLYNNIGWSYMDLEDFDNAELFFGKGLEWQSEHGSERSLNIAYWTIGRVKRSKGLFDLALEHQLNLLERKGGHDDTGYTYEEIGENLLAMSKAEEAKEYFSKAYAILKDDIWLKRDEPERLERMERLGK